VVAVKGLPVGQWTNGWTNANVLLAACSHIGASHTDEGIVAEPRDTPFTGVWAGDRKIGSIGVRVREGVSMHGLAVNVDNDLQPFEWIVPCGIEQVAMTSLARVLRSSKVARPLSVSERWFRRASSADRWRSTRPRRSKPRRIRLR
jgi:hypothetical protein